MAQLLEYTKETVSERGVVIVNVTKEGKTFFEMECLTDSPYSIEEEIQNWLDDNDYEDEEFDFKLVHTLDQKKILLDSYVQQMLGRAVSAMVTNIKKAINSGALDIEDWDVNSTILPKVVTIALLEDEAEQYKCRGTSFEKKVAKEVKNLKCFL